jgi:aspartate aminotransferase
MFMQKEQRISTKVSRMRPSLTLALKTLKEQREAKDLPVFDFGLGETKGELSSVIREAGEAAFRDGQTQYPTPAGLPELRRAVLKWLNLEDQYDIDNVVISTGAKQCLFNVFLAVCNPGDNILLESAPWVSYEPLAISATASPVLVIPREHDNMLVSVADLERNLRRRPHSRLFLINNPCNPTAQLYEEAHINALLDVCAAYGVYMVLDRLYWKIMYDGRKYPEPVINDRTKPWLIQVDGLSKNWRRTGGLRIGWSVAPTDVSRGMTNLQSHYTSGAAVPTQYAALAALTTPYDDEMVRDLQRKRNLLIEHMKDMPHVKTWPTPATFYSFWDCTPAFGKRTPDGQTINNSTELCRYLAQRAGVITASGEGFFQDGYLRWSFATSDEDIIEGMKATREALSALA